MRRSDEARQAPHPENLSAVRAQGLSQLDETSRRVSVSQDSRTELFWGGGCDVPLSGSSGAGRCSCSCKRTLFCLVRTTHGSAKPASPALATSPAGSTLASGLRDWLPLMHLLLYRQKPDPQVRGWGVQRVATEELIKRTRILCYVGILVQHSRPGLAPPHIRTATSKTWRPPT